MRNAADRASLFLAAFVVGIIGALLVLTLWLIYTAPSGG